MGETAEVLAKEFEITREDQDRFAMESHQKAESAQDEVFSVRRDRVRWTRQAASASKKTTECVAVSRWSSWQSCVRSLTPTGTVTAGNSCPLTDGAAALVLTSPTNLDRFATPPLGYITSYAIAGCDPRRMGLGPVYATAKLLKQTGLRSTTLT